MKTRQNGKMSRVQLIFLFLRGSKRYYLLAILGSLFVTLTEMITPQIIKLTVDSVIGSEPLRVPGFLAALIDAVGGVEALKGNLLWIAAAVVLIAALTAVFRFVNLLETARASETFVCRIRNLLFAHIQRLPFAWHMKNQTGRHHPALHLGRGHGAQLCDRSVHECGAHQHPAGAVAFVHDLDEPAPFGRGRWSPSRSSSPIP